MYTGVTGRGTAYSMIRRAVAGGMAESRRELGLVVQRRSGRKLAHHPGALQHLLGPGEILDHRPGGLGMLGVAD